MYADDCALCYAAPSCSELNRVLSRELNIIHNWIETNKLMLNVSEAVSIVFGSNHKVAHNPKLNLQIDGQPVQQVKES